MKKVISISILALLAVTLLAGCYFPAPTSTGTPVPSGATPAPTATPSPMLYPEQLISRSEAETLVGNALKDNADFKAAEGPLPMIFCFYDAQQAGGRFFQLTLHERTAANFSSPKDGFDALKTGAKDPVSVPDIGEDAFIAAPGLHILVDGYYLTVAVGDTTDAQNVEILKKAGQMAVEKLKEKLGTK